MTGDRRPPLVFDDPFVTLDDARAMRALELLREIARDFQVIYLTTSDRYHDAADAVVALEGPTEVDDAPRSPSPQGLPTADPAGPGLAVVVFGLASAVAWGAGDFGGGWTGRRAPVYGIARSSTRWASTIIVAAALALGEPLPGPTTLALAALAGVCAWPGSLGLYARPGRWPDGRGGSRDRPDRGDPPRRRRVPPARAVPPTAAARSASAAALVAVVLVSASTDPAGRRSGIQYAMIGGIGLGLFNVAVGAFPEHRVAWPLASSRSPRS